MLTDFFTDAATGDFDRTYSERDLGWRMELSEDPTEAAIPPRTAHKVCRISGSREPACAWIHFEGSEAADILPVSGNVSSRKPDAHMQNEKNKVPTESGPLMDVVVFSKRASGITIVLGEGIHNVRCELSPTSKGLSYSGSVSGRELIYERSREQVQADIDKANPALRKPR